MPKCIIDTSSSHTFQKNIKQLRKRYPNVGSDLEVAVCAIEADYRTACNAFCIPMPGKPELQKCIYKYDWGSSDIRKHPRECFRLIGAFLRQPGEGDTMYAIVAYYKGDRSNILPKGN